MQALEIFPVDKECIEIEGIGTFLSFARYNSDLPNIFIQGIELSEDLSSQYGTVLYTKGTDLSWERVSRLLRLRENNPNLDFTFKIKRSSRLIQTFRKDVKEQIISLFKRRLNTGAFEDLLTQLNQTIETFIDEILSEDSITLALYKLRFMRDTLSMRKSDLFLEHSINVALVKRNYFIAKDDLISTMANIILVADAFLQRESGLFGEPIPVKKAIDFLNVKVAEKRLNEIAVRALTMGMNLLELFDFYNELDTLVGKCPYSSAVPYPLVGYRSATLFVCKKTVTECKHLEINTNAVNIVKPLGVLKNGQYYRCTMLTELLNNFYKDHYQDIKDSVKSKNGTDA